MKQLFSTLIALIVFQISVLAWGRNGHTIVLSVAIQHLDENTKITLNKYLNGLSIADAASWMDEVKGESKYDHLRKLHYINLNKGESYNPESKDNIIGEINRIINELANPKGISDEAMKINLYELIHLVGDLHQPFHAIGEQKGGNDYQVQFNGAGTNLHSLWDGKILEFAKISLADVLAVSETTTNDIKVVEWMNESRSLAYAAYPSDNRLNMDYIMTNAPTVKKQLHSAGIRLAAILNKYLKGLNHEPKFEHEVVEVLEISIDSVNRYKGQTVKICTQIKSTKQIESGSKPLLLSVGEEYPYNPLTVVIYFEDLSTFKLNKEKQYKGKKICVTGKIVEYQQKLQIVVKKEEQIEIK